MKQQATVLITVLVIDNNSKHQPLYQQLLACNSGRDSGYDYLIHTVSSANDGLVYCQSKLPDVVLLNFSGIDGFQFIADLKTQTEQWHPPVIGVTCNGDESLMSSAIAAGAEDYLVLDNYSTPQLHHLGLRISKTIQIGQLRQQLHLAQGVLKNSQERLQLALKPAQVGVWEWNLSAGELSWSANCSSVLGVTPEAFTNTLDGWLSCVHPDDRDRVMQRITHAIETRSPLLNEYRIVTPSGEIRWLVCKGQVECDDAGHPVRLLGMTQDITDHKQTEDQLRQYATERARLLKLEQAAREEAETENHSKDEFLAVITHELRSPLNAILGWASLLRTRTLDPSMRDRALETIERNAKAQSRLIEDLLDVSRIIRGKLRLTCISVNLQATAMAAIDAVKLSAELKQISILLVAPESEVIIRGDPTRLQQIVLNLLTNAVKFTPNGGSVVVEVSETVDPSAVKEQGTSKIARIVVRDTGIGISPRFLPYVFDRFQQAETMTTETEKGLGLGLAIVRQLVELHQGRVWVESEGDGKGTTFVVSLPLG
jgi:PAS domain S-box-containing protein